MFFGKVKENQIWKIYDIRYYVSGKQIIVYTYYFIESAIIEHKYYGTNINDHYTSHILNEDDDAFDYQFEKWGLEKVLPDKPFED